VPVTLLLALLMLAGCGDSKITSRSKLQTLETIRLAVAKYKSRDAALADGFRPLPRCIEDVDGSGALGLEYLQLQRARDRTVDLLEPEQLFYTEGSRGSPPALAGVGYFVPDEGQKPPDSPLGHFDGPIPGQYFGEAPHFELHVWLFRHSSDGLLAFFNPGLECS
jgi:hypothetical protein